MTQDEVLARALSAVLAVALTVVVLTLGPNELPGAVVLVAVIGAGFFGISRLTNEVSREAVIAATVVFAAGLAVLATSTSVPVEAAAAMIATAGSAAALSLPFRPAALTGLVAAACGLLGLPLAGSLLISLVAGVYVTAKPPSWL